MVSSRPLAAPRSPALVMHLHPAAGSVGYLGLDHPSRVPGRPEHGLYDLADRKHRAPTNSYPGNFLKASEEKGSPWGLGFPCPRQPGARARSCAAPGRWAEGEPSLTRPFSF